MAYVGETAQIIDKQKRQLFVSPLRGGDND